jgi:transcriptional regulator with XRE-family HTH domain
MKVDQTALTLRAKILGTLIRDARISSGKSVEECAELIGVTPERFGTFEWGEASPSLPELECLAYRLEVPLDHFWGKRPLRPGDGHQALANMGLLMQLRQRMIGAMLRQARLESEITLEQLADYMECDVAELEAFELGEAPVPLPQLEVLSGVLSRSMREFHDQHGPVGRWQMKQQAVEDFLEMPLELQVFVSKPINRPYLELAVRLSEMSVERLRAVAEGLLEITY